MKQIKKILLLLSIIVATIGIQAQPISHLPTCTTCNGNSVLPIVPTGASQTYKIKASDLGSIVPTIYSSNGSIPDSTRREVSWDTTTTLQFEARWNVPTYTLYLGKYGPWLDGNTYFMLNTDNSTYYEGLFRDIGDAGSKSSYLLNRNSHIEDTDLYQAGQFIFNGPVKLFCSMFSTGDVLTVDASGNASWQAPTGGGGSDTPRWSLTGNSGTSPGPNFIGTTDNEDLIFKVNNQVSGMLQQYTNGSNVGYGIGVLSNYNSSGIQNVAMGNAALESNTGNFNVAIGESAMSNNILGGQNTAIGRICMGNNTMGNDNTAVGYIALGNNINGNGNVAIGPQSLYLNINGSNNVAIGYAALVSSLSDNNVAIGIQALQGQTTGTQNTAIGLYAGGGNMGALTTTESFNTYLGAKTDIASAGYQYGIALGYGALIDSFNKLNVSDNIIALHLGHVKNYDQPNYVLTTDGTNQSFKPVSAGVAGLSTWLQYNNSGALGADADLTYSTGTMTVGGSSGGGNIFSNTFTVNNPYLSNFYNCSFAYSGNNFITYTLPTSSAAGALINDGSGNLSWSGSTVGGGSYSTTGVALQTDFIVTHGLGYTPSQVVVTPTSSASVGGYISAKTSTTFTYTFATAPGVVSVSFDWIAKP